MAVLMRFLITFLPTLSHVWCLLFSSRAPLASLSLKASVMKYFGAQAKKVLSYSVASVSGIVLAVCSCTVLPLFSGIYQRGAGIGPATAFLYSGPAINVLAIVYSARLLGMDLGVGRVVVSISFLHYHWDDYGFI